MHLNNLSLVLAMGAQPSPPGTQPDPRGDMIKFLGMMAMLIVVMYLVMIRPQQKKAKEHANLLKTLKPKDKIVTSGGIFGEVLTVKEKTLTIRSSVSSDTKLEILKSAVSEITERAGEPSES
jgi:preprotein translocase subunit YajC